jgi:hypothetical protein
MKSKHIVFVAGLAGLFLFYACVKNATPALPIHDTVTVHKTDTLIKTDTLRKTDTLLKPVDTPNLKIGLVLYLPFNGSFADSSGNGNTITTVGGATLDYDMHGYAQSAFNSSGNGARLVVSNNGAYKVDTAFSVSFDFMIRANAYYNGGGNYDGLMTFLSIVNTLNGNGPTFDVGLTVPGMPQNFTFAINSSTSDCNISGAGNPQNLTDTTSFIPQVGSWYNAICTFTKGSASVYINGKLINTKTAGLTTALFCPTANLVVGGWWNSSPENTNGKLDEVRMYNRTLNAKEIAWLSRNFQLTSTKIRATPVTIQ